MRIRLVALDLDGTLLDPRGLLGEDVREAVGRYAAEVRSGAYSDDAHSFE